jgi:hypothetical protein
MIISGGTRKPYNFSTSSRAAQQSGDFGMKFGSSSGREAGNYRGLNASRPAGGNAGNNTMMGLSRSTKLGLADMGCPRKLQLVLHNVQQECASKVSHAQVVSHNRERGYYFLDKEKYIHKEITRATGRSRARPSSSSPTVTNFSEQWRRLDGRK